MGQGVAQSRPEGRVAMEPIVGKKYLIEERRRNVTTSFVAVVTWVEKMGNDFYYGFQPLDHTFGRWGCANEYAKPREFGKRIIKEVA